MVVEDANQLAVQITSIQTVEEAAVMEVEVAVVRNLQNPMEIVISVENILSVMTTVKDDMVNDPAKREE